MYCGDEYYEDDITSGIADDGSCDRCGEAICEHGNCECTEGCAECRKKACDQRDADREFVFQRDVIGPMFGFDQEEECR